MSSSDFCRLRAGARSPLTAAEACDRIQAFLAERAGEAGEGAATSSSLAASLRELRALLPAHGAAPAAAHHHPSEPTGDWTPC